MAKRDVFICCSDADREWGNWIDWQLRSFGLTTFFEPLDVHAGNNVVMEIHRAQAEIERTLVVLSPDLRTETLTESTWCSAFAEDPQGAKSKLIPVRVADFMPDGVFRPLKCIDLFAVDRDEAVQRLRSGISRQPRSAEEPVYPGSRVKQPAEPSFPGAVSHSSNPAALPRLRGSVCPETIAALLDKRPQAQKILKTVPERQRLVNGSAWGFFLAGRWEEWPEALRHRICVDLGLSHESDVFVPLQGKELEYWIPEDELLRSLLAAKFLPKAEHARSAPEIVEQQLVDVLSQPSPRIFYRILYPEEVRDRRRITGLLAAWRALGQRLRPSAPSHVLLLLYAPGDRTAEVNQLESLGKQLGKTFRKHGLADAMLPEPVSPRKDDVTAWASHHVPSEWQDEVANRVIDAFEARDAMPHGELKRHVVEILKPYTEARR